jgi:hypothetical protein
MDTNSVSIEQIFAELSLIEFSNLVKFRASMGAPDRSAARFSVTRTPGKIFLLVPVRCRFLLSGTPPTSPNILTRKDPRPRLQL